MVTVVLLSGTAYGAMRRAGARAALRRAALMCKAGVPTPHVATLSP
jgi:hypothetical protein